MTLEPWPLDLDASRRDPGGSLDARTERIYVNRNLKLSKIGLIGFDLDHTLAEYEGPLVEELAFDCTKGKLVEKWGYPDWVDSIRYDPDYVIRGLVLDKVRGNVLKMDYHNYVSRVYHGRRRLSESQTRRAYRSDRVRVSSPSFVSVDTLFELPEIYLFMSLVEGMETRGRAPQDYTAVYTDVRAAIDESHRDGSIKKVIMENPSVYIRRDPRLPFTLEGLRRGGKKLFLLTNSEEEYTDRVMFHLVPSGPRERGTWKDYFAAIHLEAGKPAYFLRGEGEEENVSGNVVRGGNPRLLEKMTGFSGDRVLYFGDHTYGDILKSKKSLGWRTAFIVSELDREIEVARRMGPDFDRATRLSREIHELERQRDGWAAETEIAPAGSADSPALASPGTGGTEARVRRDSLDARIAALKRRYRVLADRCDRAFNKHWGPLFREGSEASRFGHQIKDFACIYTSRVSNFLNYSPHHYFRSFGSWMPHER
jgi:5'-nucleotidase